MKNNLTTFYIVRHGQSHGNVDFEKGQMTPPSEFGSDLTQVGVRQAIKVAEELKDIHFDKIISSDLLRAKKTAEIIALERKAEVQAYNILRERNFGKLKRGIKEERDEMKRILSLLNQKEKMQYRHRPDFETAEEGAIRLITFLRETALAYPGKTILVVNHGDLMRSLLVHLGYAKYDELQSGSIPNTAYYILECDGVEFFIKETKGIVVTKIPDGN